MMAAPLVGEPYRLGERAECFHRRAVPQPLGCQCQRHCGINARLPAPGGAMPLALAPYGVLRSGCGWVEKSVKD